MPKPALRRGMAGLPRQAVSDQNLRMCHRLALVMWTGWVTVVALVPALALATEPPAATKLPELVIYVTPVRGLIDVDASGAVVGGRAKAVLENIAAAAGRRAVLRTASLPRALRDLVRLPDSCISGVLRTPELESQFRWVGLLARTSISLIARADDARDFDSPGTVQHLRLGAVRDTAGAHWARAQGLDLTEVALPDVGARMLDARRLDLLVASEITFSALPDAPSKLRVVRQLAPAEYHLACHRDTPDVLMHRLDEARQGLQRQGELRAFGVPP